LNILVLNDFGFVNGGASKIALRSAFELSRLGHRVILFTAVGPIDPELEEATGLEVICLNQHDLVNDPNRVQALTQGLWNAIAGDRLKSLLQTLDPAETVIHVHMWSKALSSSVVRAALDLQFRIVLTLHDYFAACPTGTFFNHQKQEICHLEPLSARCVTCHCDSRKYAHKLWRVGRQILQKRFGHIPEGIRDFISISDLSEEILSPYLPRGGRVHRVPNFIDVPEAKAVDVASNTQFSFSGRLSPEKGPLLLAECTQELGLDTVYIGDGPMTALVKQAAPTSVCTGWLDAKAATQELRKSRALVFPSLWYETQGLVVAEASALGIPSIVPDTCAAREWVADGMTGLWFKGGDKDDLMRQLIRLRDSPALAASMGAKAYERYWANAPTLQKHAKQLEEVYRGMLGVPSSPMSN
jgi:glycosyltransferase involved in cell wall biosynthesis